MTCYIAKTKVHRKRYNVNTSNLETPTVTPTNYTEPEVLKKKIPFLTISTTHERCAPYSMSVYLRPVSAQSQELPCMNHTPCVFQLLL